MATNTKIRTQRREQYTEIKILIKHPMENGRNRDSITGQLIPAHFIQELIINKNGKAIIIAELGGSMSKNPFFTFRLKHTELGDQLSVRWTDNLGLSDRVDHADLLVGDGRTGAHVERRYRLELLRAAAGAARNRRRRRRRRRTGDCPG